MPGEEQEQELNKTEKIEVYFLAAPQDEAICKAIRKYLTPVVRNSEIPIAVYGDFEIPPGQDIRKYKQKLYEADIVLAFISVDYLDNNECHRRTQKVIDRYNKQDTILLPILVRNCLWKSTPFVDLPLVPDNQQPINNKQYWNSEDDALTVVANEIYDAINTFNVRESAKQNATSLPTAKDNNGHFKISDNWRKIYYQKAIRKRGIAFLLDTLLTIPLFGIIAWITTRMGQAINNRPESIQFDLGNVIDSILYYGTPVLIFAMLLAWLESSKWKGTFGKIIMKIQTTDVGGNKISFQRALLRNVLRILLGNLWILNFVAIFYVILLKDEAMNGFLGAYGFMLLWAPLLVLQSLSFMFTGKLIHDRISQTVVGERLKRDYHK